MKEIKQKTCPICNNKFTPFSSTQRVDSTYCAIRFNRLVDLKKEKKKSAAAKKAFYENDISKQLELTKNVFNKLRRLQEFKWFADRGLEPECISCEKKNMDWCCGHFKTVGSQGALRYSKINTYLQCNRYCNKALSGNISGNKNTRGYLQGLEDRFGKKESKRIIEYCSKDRVKKWTCVELIEMRKNYNIEIRSLLKKK